jgi:ketosteroid isomerase-like protein
MTTTMLPNAVNGYLAAAPTGDIDATVSCFTGDAVVVDEGQSYTGMEAIRFWRAHAASVYEYTIEVLDTDRLAGDHFVVRARLDGNFPGNTVELSFDFTLRDELISRLHID